MGALLQLLTQKFSGVNRTLMLPTITFAGMRRALTWFGLCPTVVILLGNFFEDGSLGQTLCITIAYWLFVMWVMCGIFWMYKYKNKLRRFDHIIGRVIAPPILVMLLAFGVAMVVN